jgi:hypothetical protein
MMDLLVAGTFVRLDPTAFSSKKVGLARRRLRISDRRRSPRQTSRYALAEQ